MTRLTRISFSLVLSCAWASSASLPIRTYTTGQGLAHDHVNKIYRDTLGFLWICTDEGLSRFDGNRFVNYTTASGLPHIHINDMLETRSGEYWIATDGGLARFHPDGRPQRFETFTPPGPPEALRVNALAEDRDGWILVGTSAGLFRLAKGGSAQFEPVALQFPAEIPEASTVTYLLVDRQGVAWAGAVSGLYRRSKNGKWDRFVVGESPHVFVNGMAEDAQGGIWICTRQHGFGRFAGAQGERAVLDPWLQRGLPDQDVRGLWFDSAGRRWAATSSGLVDWSTPSHLTVLTAREGMSDDSIYALADDTAGNLWIGTRRGGVMRMGREDWKTFDRADGLSLGPDEMLLETAAGEMCVADLSDARRPARCLENGRFREIVPPLPPRIIQQVTNSSEMAMQDREGDWWFSTGMGAFRFPQAGNARALKRARPVRIGPEIQTTRLFEDSHGDVWIATLADGTGGLLRWERSSNRIHDESAALHGAPSEARVSALGEAPPGDLWIGLGQEGALLRLRKGRVEPIASSLQGRIASLFADHAGRLWIASLEGGLGRVDDPDADRPKVETFTTVQGLSSNEIWSVTEDRFGRIYAGNGRGVDRLDALSGQVLNYTEADGLAPGDIRSSLRDHNGDLWFLSNHGASRFRPGKDVSLPAPQTRITALRVAGARWAVSDLGTTALGPLDLSAQQNSLTVEFGAIDFASPAHAAYQYRLEGATGGWSAATTNSSVTFANLSPGKYRFVVRSASPAAPGAPEAAFQFTILPPLWRRWWFEVVLLLAAAAVAYALHRTQLQRKLALERVRSSVAMDLHDDLGASLSRMSVIAEVLKSNVRQNDLDSQLMLNDVAETSRRLVEGMNDIVWSIDPRHDQAGDIVNRIRDFASGLLEPKGIDLRLDVSARVLNARLSASQRRQLYLVCKEAIHNIARHSKARHALVRLAVDSGTLCADIEDDGCGMPSDNGHGLGLSSMRARAAELGGSLEVGPAAEQGTRVTLRFPLRS